MMTLTIDNPEVENYFENSPEKLKSFLDYFIKTKKSKPTIEAVSNEEQKEWEEIINNLSEEDKEVDKSYSVKVYI